MKKKRKFKLDKGYVLFDRKDKNFATVVKEKRKIEGDVWMLHPFQIVNFYEDILTKTEYKINETFSNRSYFTTPISMFIDEEIANNMQKDNLSYSDIVKILNNAKKYRKNL